MRQTKDGYMPFMGYKTYFKVFGKASKKPPLLMLHGGPGSSHRYILGLADLAKTGRQVIFYDQLGGGLSDKPLNSNIWSFKLFIRELQSIREFLKLENIILFGHSWGGMLAAEYMCGYEPDGVDKIIFASAMVSMPLYRKEVEVLKQGLPHVIYTTMVQHEKNGTTRSAEYLRAMKVYNERHILKLPGLPAHLQDPPDSFGQTQYEKLWGASEAFPNGSLKNWSRLEDLHLIGIPALVIAGQFDELTPRQALAAADNLPNSTIRIITGGTHLAHVEYPETYVSELKDFIG